MFPIHEVLTIGLVFSILCVTNSTAAVIDDDYEIDDYKELATLIDVSDPQAQSHNFHQINDQDWFKFYVQHDYPIPYSIYINKQQQNADAVLTVFDEQGNILAEVDDGLEGEGEYELLELRFEKDGFYYILVRQHDPQVAGEQSNYQIQVFHAEMKFKGRVIGRVLDANSSLPVQNPLITSSSALRAPYVGSASGGFIISHPSGSYNLTISADNYQTLTKSSVVINELDSTSLDVVYLTPIAEQVGSEYSNFDLSSQKLNIKRIYVPDSGNFQAEMSLNDMVNLEFTLDEISQLSESQQDTSQPSYIPAAGYVQLPIVIMGQSILTKVILKYIADSSPMRFKVVDYKLSP